MIRIFLIAALGFATPIFSEAAPPMPVIGSGKTMGDVQYETDNGGRTSKEWKTTIGSESKKEISGRCVLASEVTSAIEIPCPHLSMTLTNSAGKEIGQTTISEGKFTVAIPPGESAYLKLKSDRYKITSPKSGPFRGGDDIILRVERIK